jgi:hypothetical protein
LIFNGKISGAGNLRRSHSVVLPREYFVIAKGQASE